MAGPQVPPTKTDRVLERLTALHPKLIDLSLERMWRLLDRLGNPQAKLPPVIHVAGTNGKGSVIAYLRAIFEAAGQRAHVYTSPHLVRFAERIRLAGEIIDEAYLAEVLEACEQVNGEAPITFFEVTTAAAFVAFAKCPADVLLLETGLGGRLDATNVIDRPALTAFTPISLDHTQYLGATVREIAFEKAGILRPGVPCVVGRQSAEPAAVLADRATALGAPLHRMGTEWWIETDGPAPIWRDSANRQVMPRPGLVGLHQIDNAAMAIACLSRFSEGAVPPSAITAGLTAVEWPGRLQRLETGPLCDLAPGGSEVWLDGGHNAAAGAVLAQVMGEFAAADGAARPLHLIVAMLTSKDPVSFLAPLAPLAAGIQATAIPGEGASRAASEIVAAGDAVGRPIIGAATPAAAMTAIRAAAADGPPPRILICGSLYLAGSVLAENS